MSSRTAEARRDRFFQEALGWVAFVSAMLMLSVPCILAYQALTWLKSGQWPAISLGGFLTWSGAGTPSTEWVGAQRVLDVVLDLPLSLVAFVLPIVIMAGFMEWMSRSEERARKRRDADKTGQSRL